MNRRSFCQLSTAAAAAGITPVRAADPDSRFQLNYITSSAMYGTTVLGEILPEVANTGANAIDIWPRPHANHREQIAEMGLDAFETLLDRSDVQLGVLTHYDLGPFRLAPELPVAKRFGCKVMVCGARGSKDARGDELKASIAAFVEQMKPHADAAAEHGVSIAIENHSGQILATADGIRWFAEMATHPNLGLAYAPHHLPPDAEMQGNLIAELGDVILFFYAQQYGKGAKQKQPREDELLQMPGRGELDFTPLLRGLKKIKFTGYTEPFMHPFPRGIPILDSTSEVSAEINRARNYLDACLAKI